MSTTTLSSGMTPAATDEQIDASVSAALTAADSVSTDRIQTLGFLQQARVARLTRVANAVATQAGATAAQVAAAKGMVTASQSTAARIQLVYQQAATPAPAVSSTGWALHGRIYDAQLQPVAGHTVFLVDSQKNYQSAYGFAYTDNTGYFLLNYSGPATPSPTPTPIPTPASPAAVASPPSAAPAATATPDLFVQIVNPSARPVYLASTPFRPVLGIASYQTTTLPAGEPALGDPPAAIRKVALPPPKKGS